MRAQRDQGGQDGFAVVQVGLYGTDQSLKSLVFDSEPVNRRVVDYRLV
jgi:hypothetical protein